MNDQQWQDVEHIGELAAGAYWLGKDRDPTQTQRLGASSYVRNNREYAGVVAGQISVAHVVWIVLAKILLVPFWGATFIGMMGGALLLTNHSNMLVTTLVAGGAFVLWAYVFCWRLSLRPILRWALKKGPGITYADGYRGPMGTGETVYTNHPQTQTQVTSQTLWLPHQREGR